jgi:hypothetical protein
LRELFGNGRQQSANGGSSKAQRWLEARVEYRNQPGTTNCRIVSDSFKPKWLRKREMQGTVRVI